MSVRVSHSSVQQLSALALALAIGGCFAAEAPSESTATSGLGCSIIFCTENAATAGDGLLFDEFNLFGVPNYAGVKLVGATFGDGVTPVQITIRDDELFAVDNATSTSYWGPALVHTVIDFVHTPTGEHFQVRVEDYNRQAAMFMSGAHESVPVYAFKARRNLSDNFDFDICSNGITLLPDPTWSGYAHHAVVFRGDRYDPGKKRLKANDPKDGWSFLACNGSAASKLHLWRHTHAGAFNMAGNPVYMTTLEERTALLKGITADYCGTGKPDFTVTGTPIAFATAKEPLAFPFPRPPLTPMRSMEALWGPNGAYCLDHPRREMFGITKAAVEKKCKREFPSCAPPGTTIPPTGWWLTSHAVTANPL